MYEGSGTLSMAGRGLEVPVRIPLFIDMAGSEIESYRNGRRPGRPGATSPRGDVRSSAVLDRSRTICDQPTHDQTDGVVQDVHIDTPSQFGSGLASTLVLGTRFV